MDASRHNVTTATRRANFIISYLTTTTNYRYTMSSSPLPIFSSDDDVAMAIDDELPQTPTLHGGQSMSQAPPPPADPLFLAGTPSTQAGTPLSGVVARRAVGMNSTPRRSGRPLFAREYIQSWLTVLLIDHAYISWFIIQPCTLPFILACKKRV